MKKLLHKRLFPTLEGKWNTDINLNARAWDTYGHLREMCIDNPLLDLKDQARFVEDQHIIFGSDYSFGGFREVRNHLWRGTYLEKEQKWVHLGIDYNVPAMTPVYLPRDMTCINVFHDKDQDGGWGTRVDFRVKRRGKDFYWVHFGHLHRQVNVKSWNEYKAGTLLGYVAKPRLNGGWYPHLHLQCSNSSLLDKIRGDDPTKIMSLDDIDGYTTEANPCEYALNPVEVL